MDAHELIDTLNSIVTSMGQDAQARSYSGRGMFGKQCVSIDLDSAGDLFELGNQLGLREIKIDSPSTDSMGHGIVAYWTRIEWPEGVHSPDEDDED